MSNKVLILILFVFSIGFFLLYQNFKEVETAQYNNEEIENNNLIKDKAVDWELYRNENWGFEFKHPNDLNPKISINFGEENMFGLSLENGENIFRMGIHDEGMEYHVRLYNIDGSEKEVIIDGLSGTFFKKEDMSGASEYVPHTIVKRGSVIYVFIGEGETFDNILSTFKFI